MIRFFTCLLLLACVSFVYTQNLDVVNLTKTQGKGEFIKMITVGENTVVLREKAIQGPGGFEPILDLVDDENNTKQVELAGILESEDLEYVDIISFSGNAVLIYSQIESKTKTKSYFAYVIDPVSGEKVSTIKLFEKEINRKPFQAYFTHEEIMIATSPDTKVLGILYTNSSELDGDDYKFHVRTYADDFNEIHTTKQQIQKKPEANTIEDFRIMNTGVYCVLWGGMPKVNYFIRSMNSNKENSQDYYFSINTYSAVGEALSSVSLQKYNLYECVIGIFSDETLLIGGTVGKEKDKTSISGIKAFGLDVNFGEIEVLIDSKLDMDYVKGRVANKLSKNEIRLGRLTLTVHSESDFSLTAERIGDLSSITIFGDILASTYSNGDVNTQIVPHYELSKRSEFTSLNGELVGIVFIPEDKIKNVDLVLLRIAEELSGIKLLSREESMKIQTGPQRYEKWNPAVVSFKNGGFVYYAERSVEESFVIKIQP